MSQGFYLQNILELQKIVGKTLFYSDKGTKIFAGLPCQTSQKKRQMLL